MGRSALLPVLLPGAVALVALAVYLPTLAPTVTWHNGGADSGDLAAAVLTLGIPHPPGYPTYVLLGRAFLALPVGDEPAYRLTLLSAAGAALAAALTTWLVDRLGGGRGLGGFSLGAGAAFGGLALALTPLAWAQATIAEVYAPGLGALATLSAALLRPWPPGALGPPALAALLGGLSLGVLPQIALAAPGGLGLLVARQGWAALRPARLAALAAAAAAGLLVFAYLPWRAAAQPLVVWGDPTTPRGVWELMTATLYRGYFLSGLGPADWLTRLGESIVLLGQNLTWLGIGLACYGAALLWRGSRPELGYLLSLAALSVLFRTSYPVAGNPVYLLPALFALALLAGLGLARALAELPARLGLGARVAVALGLAVMLAVRTATLAPEIDASQDRAAEHFARAVLAALPPRAIVVAYSDEQTFSLWYRQALGERPDVVVVDSRLIHRDWYQRHLVARYPDLPPGAVQPAGLAAAGRPLYTLDAPGNDPPLRAVVP